MVSRFSLAPLVLRLAFAALLAVFIAGCATAPRLYIDSADEPLACASFAWLEPDRHATIAEQRLRGEIMSALAAKGYAKDDAEPDCLVSGVIYTGARPSPPVSVGVGAGRWGGRVGGSIGVSIPVGGGTRTVGNLAIDVIDLAQNAEVWRGTLESAFRTPDPAAEEIGGAVRKLLEGFPRHAAQ